MQSSRSDWLRAQATRVLTALFAAYEAEVSSGEAFIADFQEKNPELKDDGAEEFAEDLFRQAMSDDLNTIAGCIVVIGDNLVKSFALDNLDSPDLIRCRFGPVASTEPLGAALQAGGNAFRHFTEWATGRAPHADTKKVLDSLQFPYDDSVCRRILNLYQLTRSDLFLNAIDIIGAEMEQAAPCDGCQHVAAYHRHTKNARGPGCSFRPGLVDDLPPSDISTYIAGVLQRAQTGGYRCSCEASRESVVKSFLAKPRWVLR